MILMLFSSPSMLEYRCNSIPYWRQQRLILAFGIGKAGPIILLGEAVFIQ